MPSRSFGAVLGGASVGLFSGETSATLRVAVPDRAHASDGPTPESPRTLDVLVHDPFGRPVSGVVVALRHDGKAMARPLRTAAAGRVRFTDVEGKVGMRVVLFADPDGGRGGVEVEQVDLERRSQSVVVEVGEEVEVVAHVTLEGAPGLPGAFRLWPPVAVEEDPAAGTLRIRVRPTRVAPRLKLSLVSVGYATARIDVDLSAGTGSGPIDLDVPFRATGTLLGRLLGGPPYPTLAAERWDDDARDWVRSEREPEYEADDLQRFAPVPIGRYRVVVAGGEGAASDAVEVGSAGESVATIDAGAYVTVAGRVDVPDGIDLTEVRVIANDDVTSPDGKPPGIGLDAEGRFRLDDWVDPPLRLRARHALLVADPREPEVVVRGAATDVVLRLVAGAGGTVSLVPAADVRPASIRPARVLFFRGDPVGTPVAEKRLVGAKGGGERFGGVPAGRYTLWFDVPGRAPLVVRDVELGATPVALGRRELDRGSSIRVRVRDPADAEAWMRVSAVSLDGPRYRRAVTSTSEPVVTLRGLGPGRFRVEVAPVKGGAERRTREVVVDGESDVLVGLE